MKNKMNRKGLAPLAIVLFIFLILTGIYVVLFIPIPAFTKLRVTINYYFVVIIWFALQVGIVYAYYKLAVLIVRGFNIYKNKLLKLTFNVKKFILRHS